MLTVSFSPIRATWQVRDAGVPLAGRGAFRGERDDPDRLRWRHAEVAADLARSMPLRIRQGAVRQADPDDLGEEPLPGRDRELRGEDVQALGRRPDIVRFGLKIGVHRGLVIVGHARALDYVDHPSPCRAAARIAGLEHDDRRGSHPDRKRRLHLRRRGQREDTGRVPGAALRALDELARLVERYDRDEEQVDPPPAGPVAVGPVTTAPLAVKGSLADGTEIDPQSEDQEHPAASTSEMTSSPRAGDIPRYRATVPATARSRAVSDPSARPTSTTFARNHSLACMSS